MALLKVLGYKLVSVESPLFHIKRSQFRKLRHWTRTPPGFLLREMFKACPTGVP